MKLFWTILRTICLVVLWGLLLFIRHVIYIDVFETNYFYLYLLIILFALAEYAVLYLASKLQNRKCLLIIYFIGYICVFLYKLGIEEVFQYVNFHTLDLRGLSILCSLTTLLGGAFAFWLLKRQKSAKIKIKYKI